MRCACGTGGSAHDSHRPVLGIRSDEGSPGRVLVRQGQGRAEPPQNCGDRTTPRFSAPPKPPPPHCTADNPDQLAPGCRRKTLPRRPTRPTRRRTSSRAVVAPVGGTNPLWSEARCVSGTNAVYSYGLGRWGGKWNCLFFNRRLELLEQASLGLVKSADAWLFSAPPRPAQARGREARGPMRLTMPLLMTAGMLMTQPETPSKMARARVGSEASQNDPAPNAAPVRLWPTLQVTSVLISSTRTFSPT